MKFVKLLRITGILDFLFAIMHFTFPLMPVWKPALDGLPGEMRYIFITFHYGFIVFLAGMGFITTFQARQLLESPIRESLAMLFSSLFVVRIITEFSLWKFQWPQSIIILPFCLFPVASYTAVLFAPKQNSEV